MNRNEELAYEVETFSVCFHANEDIIVAGAPYELEKKKLENTRRPCSLPMEKDIEAIHSYVIKRMTELVAEFEFWNSHSFVELSNNVLTRLTLLNGRRRGEVARLQIQDWKAGENNTWIENQRLENLNDADKIFKNNLYDWQR